MRTVKCSFLFIAFTVWSFSANATIWTTSNFGYWNNGANWYGGVVPPHSSSDTFYIAHPLVIENTITLQPGAFISIDTTGGICGHKRMVIHTNAVLHNRGILELDSLFVPGGIVQNFLTGNLILSYNAIIMYPGQLTSNGGISVGPWFICHQPTYSFLTASAESVEFNELKIYPNPASDKLHIVSDHIVERVVIKTLNGMLISNGRITNGEVPIEQLPDGLYLFEFFNRQEEKIAFKKIMVLK